MKFLLIAGLADSILNFRGELVAALQARGVEVHVAAPDLPVGNATRIQLESRGLTVHSTQMHRTGTNPFSDFGTLVSLCAMMRKTRPYWVLSYTIKPVLYGSLAAWMTGVPRRFAMITGLGYTFQGEGRRRRLQGLVRRMLAYSLSHVQKVFFQNSDDEKLFRGSGILSDRTPSVVVNGSGVDLETFAVAPMPKAGAHFLLIARLLGDKGVREYAEASRRVKAKHPSATFSLAGWIDDHPDSITPRELDSWIAEDGLNFHGRLNDVRSAIAASSVYVLPSHREGTPRTVLEAMAMGRPIITTDAPGCRETVIEGVNGFLVTVGSVDALEQAMVRFIMDPTIAARMGAKSRLLAEEKYDVHKVNAEILRAMGIE